MSCSSWLLVQTLPSTSECCGDTIEACAEVDCHSFGNG